MLRSCDPGGRLVGGVIRYARQLTGIANAPLRGVGLQIRPRGLRLCPSDWVGRDDKGFDRRLCGALQLFTIVCFKGVHTCVAVAPLHGVGLQIRPRG